MLLFNIRHKPSYENGSMFPCEKGQNEKTNWLWVPDVHGKMFEHCNVLPYLRINLIKSILRNCFGIKFCANAHHFFIISEGNTTAAAAAAAAAEQAVAWKLMHHTVSGPPVWL